MTTMTDLFIMRAIKPLLYQRFRKKLNVSIGTTSYTIIARTVRTFLVHTKSFYCFLTVNHIQSRLSAHSNNNLIVFNSAIVVISNSDFIVP